MSSMEEKPLNIFVLKEMLVKVTQYQHFFVYFSIENIIFTLVKWQV